MDYFLEKKRKIAEKEDVLLLSCILKLILRQDWLGEFVLVRGGGHILMCLLFISALYFAGSCLTEITCLLAVCCTHLKGNWSFLAA